MVWARASCANGTLVLRDVRHALAGALRVHWPLVDLDTRGSSMYQSVLRTVSPYPVALEKSDVLTLVVL